MDGPADPHSSNGPSSDSCSQYYEDGSSTSGQEVRSIVRDRIVKEHDVVVLEFNTAKRQEFLDTIAFLTFEDGDDMLSAAPFRPSPSPSTLMDHLSIEGGVELAEFDVAMGEYVPTRDLSVQTVQVAFHRAVFHNDAPKKQVIQEALTPHPPYLAYTLARQSIARFRGVDTTRLDFIAYADMEGFPVEHLASCYKSLAWQKLRDPDRTLVLGELVRRLVYAQTPKISLSDVKSHLPSMLRTDFQTLFHRVRNRDLVSWPNFPLFENWAPEAHVTGGGTGKSLDVLPGPILLPVSKAHYKFCRMCFVWFCHLHDNPHVPLQPEVLPQPERTHHGLLKKRGALCTPPEKCFKNNNIIVDQEDEDEVDDGILKDMLQLEPDALPCDVAIVARRPCYQVFRLRQQMLDHELLNKARDARRKKQKKRSKVHKTQKDIKLFDDTGPDDVTGKTGLAHFTPVPPCLHKGPCHTGNAFNCACWAKNQHCTSSCLCSPECEMRWQGCHSVCKSKGKCSKLKGICPCINANKECDPMLCHPHSDDANKNCANDNILGSPAIPLHIRRATYGLGAFTTQAVKKDEFIGEYTGVVSDSYHNTQLTDPLIYDFTGYNYAFGLRAVERETDNDDAHGPEYVSLDSLQVGNETRYLNHASCENVVARTKFVNAAHRIGFYATANIEAGEELFLDYGEDYFITGEAWETGEGGDTTSVVS